MDEMKQSERQTIFISKATPHDDEFVLWLAPRLEAAGYKVFADILCLQTGDGWRLKLTDALQKDAVKMLLCCSDTTLRRDGVIQEIEIAKDLTKELDDENFILPLRMKPFKKVFGIGSLQYADFASGWHNGLETLLKTLEEQSVPTASGGHIQPEWQEYLQRRAVKTESSPETLTTNWLRILSAPDVLFYLEPKNTFEGKAVQSMASTFPLPLVPYGRGFLSFASPFEFEEHFSVGPFEIKAEIDFQRFLEEGNLELQIEPRDARSMTNNLLRQAWEKHMTSLGFYQRAYSAGSAFHVTKDQIGLNKRVSWGRQGQRRNSALRNISKKKEWSYGVSAVPGLSPWPHIKLKSRVLFSDPDEKGGPSKVIEDHRKQHRLRRSVCSAWRNKSWHGRLMALMEVIAGDSPYVDMPVGGGMSITADAMPIQVTSPVTARQTHRMDEDAVELDESTITGGPIEEEVDTEGSTTNKIAPKGTANDDTSQGENAA